MALKVKLVFIMIWLVEGSFSFKAEGSATWSRPMDRCECAEMRFEEFARRMSEEGLSFEEAAERTGCGRICSACLPDLREHVRQPR